jgi:imidazolonepropionase
VGRSQSLEIRRLSCLATPRGRRAAAGPSQGDLQVLREAAVRCEDGAIVFVGTEAEISRRGYPAADREIDGAGKTLLPGFVDAHTHPVWAGDRCDEFARRLARETYSSIAAEGGGIRATVAATRATSRGALAAAARGRLLHMHRAGTTTAECKSGYALEPAGEIRSLEILQEISREVPVRVVPTLLAAHDVPDEYSARRQEWVRLIVEEIIPAAASRRLAEFCDVFCDEGAFTVDEAREILTRARQAGLGIRLHAEELARTGGARLAAELSAASADHLLKIEADDIAALRASGTVATLLPGTSWWLKSRPAPARDLIGAGVPVAIGTDANPGSCNTESLPAVAAHACLDAGMTIEEAITAITLNGAAAVSRAAEAGSIEEGKAADLVLLDAPDYRHLIYHWGVNLVAATIVEGHVHEF